jgi:hypothetical protein
LPIRSITIVELEMPSPLKSNLAELQNAFNSYLIGFALTLILIHLLWKGSATDNILRKLTQRVAVEVVIENYRVIGLKRI